MAMWRIIQPNEKFIFQYCDDPGLNYGYHCKVGVLLHGHLTCGCDRSTEHGHQRAIEFVHLYRPHSADHPCMCTICQDWLTRGSPLLCESAFPVYFSVSDQWLQLVNDDGKFGFDGAAGFLVVAPTSCSYGYLVITV